MRFRSLALVLLGLIVGAIEARADDNSDSNSSNNPVAPKLTLEYWNYYATSLNQLNGDAENGVGRVLIPFKVNGIQQVFHVDPSIVTAPAATSGPRTGLGATQIYNCHSHHARRRPARKSHIRHRTSRRGPDSDQHQFRP